MQLNESVMFIVVLEYDDPAAVTAHDQIVLLHAEEAEGHDFADDSEALLPEYHPHLARLLVEPQHFQHLCALSHYEFVPIDSRKATVN
jgi:hypothetical protein